MAGAFSFAAQPASAPTLDERSGRPTAKLRAFDLADVTLDEGPFLDAQRKTETCLLEHSTT
ncbi:MAG: hypothetical protein PSY12_11985 [bacterium]|nr:hypothetical protein [bacterium]